MFIFPLTSKKTPLLLPAHAEYAKKGVTTMSTKSNTLGTNVRRLRTNLHLTQQKLGEKLFHEKLGFQKLNLDI